MPYKVVVEVDHATQDRWGKMPNEKSVYDWIHSQLVGSSAVLNVASIVVHKMDRNEEMIMRAVT